MDGFDVLLRDFADENILQVDFGLADQVEQKIQRPVELLQTNVNRHVTPAPR